MLRLIQSIILIMLASTTLFAAVPQTISYQGHLASSGGAPVNAAVYMTFTIYNAATNGTNLWTEDQTIQVNNGIYAVALGAVNPIDPAIIDGDLWLGVKVGTDAEMTPRQKLSSVPFAMKANSATSIDSIPVIYSGYCSTGSSQTTKYCLDMTTYNSASLHLSVNAIGDIEVLQSGCYRIHAETVVTGSNSGIYASLKVNSISVAESSVGLNPAGPSVTSAVALDRILCLQAGDVVYADFSNISDNYVAGPIKSHLEVQYIGRPLN